MKHFFLFISLLFLLCGCVNSRSFPNNFGDALSHAENVMRNQGFITASSFNPEEYAKFRIMVSNDIANEEAKQIVTEFINEFENQLIDPEVFYESHFIQFDIKSNRDGTILYKGKKDSDKEIWWQF